MRQWLFACALALAACATPVEADPPEIDYAGRVVDCANAAGGERSALDACKGAASQSCMDVDGVTTIGMVMCLSHESDAWASIMDAALLRLSEARPETAGALMSAQEQWRAYREAECSYHVARWGEGSGARVQLAGCMANVTADRAIALLVVERVEGQSTGVPA